MGELGIAISVCSSCCLQHKIATAWLASCLFRGATRSGGAPCAADTPVGQPAAPTCLQGLCGSCCLRGQAFRFANVCREAEMRPLSVLKSSQ